MDQVLGHDLIGRGDELLTLLNAIDQAAKGKGEAVLVLGEAGVGKSRLLREAREAAASAGMAVMVARAVPGGRTAFRLLAEAVQEERRAHGLPQDAGLAPFVLALRQLASGPEARSAGIDVDPGWWSARPWPASSVLSAAPVAVCSCSRLRFLECRQAVVL